MARPLGINDPIVARFRNDVVSFAPLETNHDWVVLRLRRSTTANNEIDASYAYVDGLAVDISTAPLTFTPLAGSTPIFQGEPSTRAQFRTLTLVPQASFATLVSGSKTSISQDITTTSATSELTFNYRFVNVDGTLNVYLDGNLLQPFQAVNPVDPGFTSASIPINGSVTGTLKFELDANTGSSVILDNIAVEGLTNGDFASGDLTGWTPESESGNLALAGVLSVEGPEFAEVKIARAKVETKRDSEVEIRGRFTPGDGGVIDPTAEGATVIFGDYSETIPPESFAFRHGAYVFKDRHGGLKQLRISENGWFSLEAEDIDLADTDFANPVPFILVVGNTLGSSEIEFRCRDKKGKRSHYHHALSCWAGGH